MKKPGQIFRSPISIPTLILIGLALMVMQWLFDGKEPLNHYERAQRQTVLIQTSHSQGSGVVVERDSPNGKRLFIWTAAHVVEDESAVVAKRILRFDGHKAGEMVFRARVLCSFPAEDAALLYLNADPRYFIGAAFETAEPLRVGEPLYHVGNFYGVDFDGSVSVGVVSQIGIRPNRAWPWELTDQTTATMVPGSSGGPLFRASDDRVIGLVVGGPMRGVDGVGAYVPVRVILSAASKAGISWAVHGDRCPLDHNLKAMADRLAAEVAAVVAAKAKKQKEQEPIVPDPGCAR